ncbi:MAG TPA: hypothetical protein VMB27_16385 [Solirubrobacteraceae bacterium]|nr:hypothetical protein [Solirubrobacteraceae bacterium]
MTRITDPNFRLRDHHTPPTLPTSPKTGLILETLHRPELKLADYIHPQLATPPAAISRPHAGFSWGMLANDRIGDCVIAMMLHSIEDFHLDSGTPVPAFTDADAISVYSAITGYNPNDPSSDRGTDENAAMRYWEHPGLSTSDGLSHSIVATVAVDPNNLTECRIAIDEFVDLQIGVALPLSAQGQTEWTVVGDGKTGKSAPGSWGGHGIPYREFDPETFKCVTWGTELLLTVPFHQDYAQEAHVVVTKEMLNKTGVGPSGVAWDELIADIKALPRNQGAGAGDSAGDALTTLA